MRYLVASLMLACSLPALAQDEPADTPAKPSEREAKLAHVEQRGEGDVTMLLIPSIWCDWSIYDEFMERNKDRYTMYAVTLRGNAGSEPPPTPDHPDDFAAMQWTSFAADGILELIKDESLEDVVLVGHGTGGQLAMKVAIEHPIYVDRVVSIDGEPATPLTSGDVSREDRTFIVNQKLAKDRAPPQIWASLLRNVANSMVSNPGRAAVLADMMSQVPLETGRRYLLEMYAEDLTDRLLGLKQPILLIAPIPPDLSDAEADHKHDRWLSAFAGMDHAQVIFFDDSRSFVMFDQPEQLDKAIAEFLGAGPDEPESADAP